MVVHQKLGSQFARVKRVVALAAEIAPRVGANVAEAKRAAMLSKADLVTEMVGEFPELQGLMGRYYALAQREPEAFVNAIADHYRPLGPTDLRCMQTEALRHNRAKEGGEQAAAEAAAAEFERLRAEVLDKRGLDLLAFFHDRLKVFLRDAGARHDLVDAVITPKSDDIFQIAQRVEALSAFLSSEDGKNLLAGYKRAVNILVAEERKDETTYPGTLALAARKGPEEAALARAVEIAHAGAQQKSASAHYAAAMTSLAALRAPVDVFFEKVLVNDSDPALRTNRLNLLARLRDTMHLVADFSKVSG